MASATIAGVCAAATVVDNGCVTEERGGITDPLSVTGMHRKLFFGLLLWAAGSAAQSVERWGVFEASLPGPSSGNPFLEVRFGAHFRFGHRVVDAEGFYDGGGTYRVRFMPDEPGEWSYTTFSNVAALDGKSGKFTVVAPSAKNHGPVRVRDTTHFAYEDGTPYVPIGTT